MTDRLSKRRRCQCITFEFILAQFLFYHESIYFLSWTYLRSKIWSIVRWAVERRVNIIIRHQCWLIRFMSDNQSTSIRFSACMWATQAHDMLLHFFHVAFYILNFLIYSINTWFRCLFLLWNCSGLEEITRSVCSSGYLRNSRATSNILLLDVKSSIHARGLGCCDCLSCHCTLMNSHLWHHRSSISHFILSLCRQYLDFRCRYSSCRLPSIIFPCLNSINSLV